MSVASSLYLLGISSALWAIIPLSVIWDARNSNRKLWALVFGLGSLSLLISSIFSLFHSAVNFHFALPIYLGKVPAAFHVDPLAAWFLMIIGAAGCSLSFYISDYMDHIKRRVDMRIFWAALSLLMISMALVVLASNAQTFLIAWELMSLSSFALVATDHREKANRDAAMVYLGATRIGTALIAGGFLWAHALNGSWMFEEWHLQGIQALGPGLLILLGLGVKAGMWPFHVWLPLAHSAAPSPVSSLMSGVMVKTAIYMMARLFLFSSAFAHPAFGYLLLTLGAISSFWGILFALLQQDIKRALAYSTVENVGLILIGFGGAIAGRTLGIPLVVILGAGAALFHALNHSLFKSLLFMGAGSVDIAAHTRDLNNLGGLARNMPVTTAFFTLGAAAASALPPLNGFAGEWVLYQGSLHIAFSGASPLIRFCGMMIIGWIALIGTLAAAGFVRIIGVGFLGRPRSRSAEHAHEVSLGMRIGQSIPAFGCVALGLAAPQALHLIGRLTSQLSPNSQPLSSIWTLPISSLLLTFLISVGLVMIWMERAGRKEPARVYITWECGFGELTPRMQAAAASFAQPIARLFGALYRYAVHRKIEGRQPRHFPEEINVEGTTESLLENQIYRPAIHLIERAGGWMARLQAGSIHLYLLTMLITLIALLVIGGRSR